MEARRESGPNVPSWLEAGSGFRPRPSESESAWFPHDSLCSYPHLIFISTSNLVAGQGRGEQPTLLVREIGPKNPVDSASP